jgi:predicted membrane protein (TIGR00267 family)
LISSLKQVALLLRITNSQDIIRRYFVVNGFDGALTMLGIIVGFSLGSTTSLTVTINACVGAAIALAISGLSSAYISEHAELKHTLMELENIMLVNMENTVHGQAARWVPIFVALVNGLSPLVISLLIIAPLWLADAGVSLIFSPLLMASIIAMTLVFFLGIFLGHVSGVSWLISGLRTLLISLVTIFLIYLFSKK